MLYLKFNERLISKDNEKIYNRAGRFFLSLKFKNFEENIAIQAKLQYQSKPLTGDLQVTIVAHFKNKKHADCYNLPKGLCDSLNKLVWQDDRQIKLGIIQVIENSKTEFIEMWIKEG